MTLDPHIADQVLTTGEQDSPLADSGRVDRSDAEALRERFAAAPWAFDFFQALRRVQCAWPDKPRLGRSTRVSEDPIRLGQEPTLKFPPSTIARYERRDLGRGDRMTVYFLGMFGPHGPLPGHLTEYALDRQRDYGDVTFARFADVFHHRILCLFFRAWAESRPTASFDRPDSDRFGAFVGSLCGLGTPQLLNRDAMPDRTKLYFAGLLAGRTRSPERLVAILKYFFDVPVRLTQFVGRWLRLPEANQCRMDRDRRTGVLGRSATIGTRVWDCQSRFRLTAGPLTLKEYRRFLPDGSSLDALIAVVRNAVGDELAWDLRLVLKKDEVPAACLDGGSSLGRTSWLLSRRPERDADDFVFAPQEH